MCASGAQTSVDGFGFLVAGSPGRGQRGALSHRAGPCLPTYSFACRWGQVYHTLSMPELRPLLPPPLMADSDLSLAPHPQGLARRSRWPVVIVLPCQRDRGSASLPSTPLSAAQNQKTPGLLCSSEMGFCSCFLPLAPQCRLQGPGQGEATLEHCGAWAVRSGPGSALGRLLEELV